MIAGKDDGAITAAAEDVAKQCETLGLRVVIDDRVG
ncbi:MAG: hypothetical protein RIS07_1282, partial [Actinomycetota bacterium]